jgi:hypothetical protein
MWKQLKEWHSLPILGSSFEIINNRGESQTICGNSSRSGILFPSWEVLLRSGTASNSVKICFQEQDSILLIMLEAFLDVLTSEPDLRPQPERWMLNLVETSLCRHNGIEQGVIRHRYIRTLSATIED